MSKVHISDHPITQHTLAHLRAKERPDWELRELQRKGHPNYGSH